MDEWVKPREENGPQGENAVNARGERDQGRFMELQKVSRAGVCSSREEAELMFKGFCRPYDYMPTQNYFWSQFKWAFSVAWYLSGSLLPLFPLTMWIHYTFKLPSSPQKVETIQRCSSIDVQINELRYTQAMTCYLTIEMFDVSIHTTIWMNLEIMMISERSQNKKPYIVWFHLHEISRIGNAYRWKVDEPVPGAGGRLTAWRCRDSSGGDKKCSGIRQDNAWATLCIC